MAGLMPVESSAAGLSRPQAARDPAPDAPVSGRHQLGSAGRTALAPSAAVSPAGGLLVVNDQWLLVAPGHHCTVLQTSAEQMNALTGRCELSRTRTEPGSLPPAGLAAGRLSSFYTRQPHTHALTH